MRERRALLRLELLLQSRVGRRHRLRERHRLRADHDGYGSSATASFCGCSSSKPSGYAVDGGDCCDSEANAFPGQTGWFTGQRTGCGGYDYNCDSVQEPRYTVLGACEPTACTVTPPGWFVAAPACGGVGAWVDGCYFSGATMQCAASATASQTQSCR